MNGYIKIDGKVMTGELDGECVDDSMRQNRWKTGRRESGEGHMYDGVVLTTPARKNSPETCFRLLGFAVLVMILLAV